MKLTDYTGIALDTLLDDETMELRVWIPELSPFMQKDPSEITPVVVDIQNLANNSKSHFELTTVAFVVCKFYGCINKLRPNVHVGEQVKIVMIEDDTNTYYWDIIGRNNDLRTSERLKIFITDKPSQLDPLTDDTSYFVDANSRIGERKVHMHLSQGTGEAVGYDLTFDMEASTVELRDTVGNYALLESLPMQFHVENANGDHVYIYPEHIHAEIKNTDQIDITPDHIFAKIKNTDELDITPDDIRATINNGDKVRIQPDDILLETASETKVQLTAEECLIDVPLTHITGDLLVDGVSTLVGSTQASTIAASGTIAAVSTIYSVEEVFAGSIALSSHKHPHGIGPGTTEGPQ